MLFVIIVLAVRQKPTTNTLFNRELIHTEVNYGTRKMETCRKLVSDA
jgi:hypothetical protein